MAIKLLSFDLQGTLTDHEFSSEVWLELLPKVFKRAQNKMRRCDFDALLEDFKQIKENDRRYYDIHYWLKRAGSAETVCSLVSKAKIKPRIFPTMKKIVQEFGKRFHLIVISATTKEFINLELKSSGVKFKKVYSSYDDFSGAGKPAAIFTQVSKEWGFKPEECFHTGDHRLMDGESPRDAGWHSLYLASKVSEGTRAEEVRKLLVRLQ